MAIHPFPPLLPADRAPDRPLRLGLLTPHNVRDRRSFSGTPFHAVRALEHRPGLDLRLLGSHRAPSPLDRVLRRRTSRTGAFEARDLDGLDAVLGLVATPLLDRLARLRPGLPVLHVTDATPAFLREAYGWAIPADIDAAEARVAEQARAVIYSSEHIARRAPGDLGLPGLAPQVLPFGVNLETVPDRRPEKPPLDRLELLFVGLDWTRKGGDIAVAALDSLATRGQRARLTIVGRAPEHLRTRDDIRITGFLNKNRPRDLARLTALYREAHLLLLPSRADCTPMVVAEAMAHATPVIATDTGGIAALIGGGGAGRVLPPFAPPGAWGDAIRQATADPDSYALMSDAAFEGAAARLSWDAWARGIEMTAHHVTAGAETGAGAGRPRAGAAL